MSVVSHTPLRMLGTVYAKSLAKPLSNVASTWAGGTIETKGRQLKLNCDEYGNTCKHPLCLLGERDAGVPGQSFEGTGTYIRYKSLRTKSFPHIVLNQCTRGRLIKHIPVGDFGYRFSVNSEIFF